MDSIRKFIDWAGPAVYVVMFAMAVWLIWKAGWQNIDLNLSGVQYDGFAVVPVMIGAIALVVSYFSGPMLNFGDFSRYGKSFNAIKMGNFLGLPINFLGFFFTYCGLYCCNASSVRQAHYRPCRDGR